MKKKRSNRTDDEQHQRRGTTNPSGDTKPAHQDEPTSIEDDVSAPPPSPTDTTHPHDRLFKEVFSTVEAQFRQPLMTAIEENVYTEEEGTRMKSIADAIREEGMMTGLERGMSQGLERGKADILVRQLRRRFGLTEEEEAIVRDCHDAERLDEAAEACVDPETGTDEILALLKEKSGTEYR